ncbi:PREDICTED: mitochondrial enolase superfamily member 1-like [Priapulus caudatus]|uniref:Mitochondrial enolase superfamily member 1-like n=1 Tax=Priapulus caudatus TaxID=37621 RepID=A0ABM1EN06_PRICU|nr:PREDICTED: mitochondrial enolase superfamily member 1-like [Priapulus caudatus]
MAASDAHVIVSVDVKDVRFPTSLEGDGSDAMVILTTSLALKAKWPNIYYRRGTMIVVQAVKSMCHLVVGQKLKNIFDDFSSFWRKLTSDSQLRWVGPEKGVIHLATAAIVNALWDLWGKAEGKPVWKLLTDMTPEQIVSLVDFRYITDALTPDEALAILKQHQSTKHEREAQLVEQGYPAYTTSVAWLGYSDDKIEKLGKQALDEGWTNVTHYDKHTDPDYSCAYVILTTSLALKGHGLTFTIGKGTEIATGGANRAAEICKKVAVSSAGKASAPRSLPKCQYVRHTGVRLTRACLNLNKHMESTTIRSVARMVTSRHSAHMHIETALTEIEHILLMFVEVLGVPGGPDMLALQPLGIGVATGEQCHNRVMFKQFLQAGAMQFCQIDSCRLGGVNEIIAVLLLAAKFKVPVCPHAGGLGLCELVQHMAIFDYICVSASLENRVTEFVDHLHEHFVNPVIIRNAAYIPPQAPGYSSELKQESLDAHTYPGGSTWQMLFHKGIFKSN